MSILSLAVTLLPALLVTAFGDPGQAPLGAGVDCVAIGCAPPAQTLVVPGSTFIQTIVTDGNTVQPTGFPSASGGTFTPDGAGTGTATWTNTRPTTLVIPAPTPPVPGQIYTSYYVAFTTETIGGTPTAITRVEPTITSSTSLVPTTTSPPTPPPVCTPVPIKDWTDFIIDKSGGKPVARTITVNNPGPGDATLLITDREMKTDVYSVEIDGVDVGQTSGVQIDRTAYCDTVAECLTKKWSFGKWTVGAGSHKVVIRRIGKDLNFPSWLGSYKLETIPNC